MIFKLVTKELKIIIKKIILSIVFIILLIGCKDTKKAKFVDSEDLSTTEYVETKKPIFLYEDLEGNQVSLEDYKGKRVVLNYWATWCRPCIEEMPAMARAQELLKNDNYIFLFASDQATEKIIAFRDKRKFGLNFIKYNGSYADLQITALPVTFIFNELREQVERIEGAPIWDSPEMISKLKQLK